MATKRTVLIIRSWKGNEPGNCKCNCIRFDGPCVVLLRGVNFKSWCNRKHLNSQCNQIEVVIIRNPLGQSQRRFRSTHFCRSPANILKNEIQPFCEFLVAAQNYPYYLQLRICRNFNSIWTSITFTFSVKDRHFINFPPICCEFSLNYGPECCIQYSLFVMQDLLWTSIVNWPLECRNETSVI